MTEPEEQAIRRQQWNVDRLKQELGQKQTVLSNLQSEYEELCIFMTEKDHLQEELDALSLAGETIQSLSVQMQSRIGDRLKQQMSKTLSSLTNGRYLQVNMDENLRIGLHTADEYVPLETGQPRHDRAGVLCAPHGGDGCALRRGGAAGDSR